MTFDLFSALIDSRTAGMSYFGGVAGQRGWLPTGQALYDEWDRCNKASQRDTLEWVTFAEHSRRALQATYRHFELDADLDADLSDLFASVPSWPLWPDVAEGLAALAAEFRVGVLSNVDTDIFRLTKVASLVDDTLVLTSERLRVYKPAAAIYRRARAHAQGAAFVHVATSARDVRGATEAGVPMIRLIRPGHVTDPTAPPPATATATATEATSMDDVAERLHRMA